MMKAIRTFETSIYYNETTWRNVTEGYRSFLDCHRDSLFVTDCFAQYVIELVSCKTTWNRNAHFRQNKEHCIESTLVLFSPKNN
jgi:hypothetical protein